MDRFLVKTDSKSNEKQIVKGDGWRITVLTDRLLRVETGEFCDEATQCVWYRDFGDANFAAKRDGNTIEIKTEKTTFYFDVSKKKVVRVALSDGRNVRNFKRGVLPGTRRTLDMTDGKAKLGKSVV